MSISETPGTLSPRSNYFIIIASLLCCISVYSIYHLYFWFYTQSTENAYIEGDITLVSPEVNGIVQKIYFKENDKVRKGDILVKIDDEDYQSALVAAESERASAQLEVSILDSEAEVANFQIEKLQSDLALAASNLQNAKKEFDRINALTLDKFSSKKIFDNTLFAQKKAQSEYDNIMIALKSAKTNVFILALKKKSLLQQINGLASKIETAKNNLDNTSIQSPINGVVTSNGARVGGYVRPGAHILAVVPQEGRYVKANFKETQIQKFKPGMHAHISLDAMAGKKFEGVIRNIYPATGSKFSLIPTDNATGNFTKIVQRIPVIIDITIPEDIKDKIAIGMSCSVHIRIDQ